MLIHRCRGYTSNPCYGLNSRQHATAVLIWCHGELELFRKHKSEKEIVLARGMPKVVGEDEGEGSC